MQGRDTLRHRNAKGVPRITSQIVIELTEGETKQAIIENLVTVQLSEDQSVIPAKAGIRDENNLLSRFPIKACGNDKFLCLVGALPRVELLQKIFAVPLDRGAERQLFPKGGIQQKSDFLSSAPDYSLTGEPPSAKLKKSEKIYNFLRRQSLMKLKEYGSSLGCLILARELKKAKLKVNLGQLYTLIGDGASLAKVLEIEETEFKEWKPRKINLPFLGAEKIVSRWLLYLEDGIRPPRLDAPMTQELSYYLGFRRLCRKLNYAALIYLVRSYADSDAQYAGIKAFIDKQIEEDRGLLENIPFDAEIASPLTSTMSMARNDELYLNCGKLLYSFDERFAQARRSGL